MNILIDIGHPADFHTFKNIAAQLKQKGHNVLFTCREKEYVTHFLKEYSFSFTSLGKNQKSLPGKLLGLIIFGVKLFLVARQFKPDIFFSHSSMYAAHVAWLIGKPHVCLEDTFNKEQVNLYIPFSEVILTSDYVNPLINLKKTIKYSGYHELAYLHPNNFYPDKTILKELGLEEDEKFVIVRFVAWRASHDIGHYGMSEDNKLKAVSAFAKYGKVFISSEANISEQMERYRFPLEPQKMHHAIAFASLVFGESATMVAEGAVLGVPGIYLDNTGRYYTREMEKKYGLVFNYTASEKDQQRSIEKGIEILKDSNVKRSWHNKRHLMLKNKIDVTAFLVWFIENYPESAKIMREDPDYQYRFK